MGKLVLDRKDGEGVRCLLEDGREIHVALHFANGRPKLVFEAPSSIRILRDELAPRDRSYDAPRRGAVA
ncbi:MAG: carbon storage regulator [Planctomycetia bacterium]|nr:carbon storage regulator [Planctomycetia bacterium]